MDTTGATAFVYIHMRTVQYVHSKPFRLELLTQWVFRGYSMTHCINEQAIL